MMHSFFRTTLFLGFLLPVLSFADDIDIADKVVPTQPRDPIPFQKFPMEDPETGKPLHPNDMITLFTEAGHAKKIRAADFFRQLNKMESQLNLWGYTLRDEADHFGTLQELYVNREKVKQKVKALNRAHRDPHNKQNPLETAEAFKKALDKAWKNYETPSLDDLYKLARDEGHDVPLPEVPLFPPPPHVEFEDVPMEWEKRRDWVRNISKGEFGGVAKAHAFIQANKTEVRAEAEGSLVGDIVGQQKELLKAYVKARSPASRNGSIKARIRIMGKDLFKYDKQTPELKWGDHYSKSLAYRYNYRFALGVIPMKAEVGARGEAYFKWEAGVYPLRVKAYGRPGADVDVYAQVGADVVVAGAGGGGQVLLIRDTFTLQGDAFFEFKEEPTLTMALKANNLLELLKGRIYAYVYVYRPDYLPPFYKKASWDWDLINWDGFTYKGNIMDYRLVMTPSGVRSSGDLTPQEVAEVEGLDRTRAVAAMEQKSADVGEQIFRYLQDNLTGEAQTEYLRAMAKLRAGDEAVELAWEDYKQKVADWVR